MNCFLSIMPPFGIIYGTDDEIAMPGGRSICHCLFGELRLVTRVKTGMRQSITSQNLCDGWAKYRQNAYIS